MYKNLKRKYDNITSDVRFYEILRGSVWTLFARILATFLALVSNVVIARVYGAEALGSVAVIESYLVLITIFTVLGTDTAILRLIPEHLAKYSPTSAFKVYRKTIYIVMSVSIAAGILFYFLSNIIAIKVFSKPHLSFYLAIAAMFVVFRSAMLLNTQAIRGLSMIRLFAYMLVLPHGTNLLLLISFGFLWHSNYIPIYAFLGSFALAGTIGWIATEYSFKIKIKTEDTVNTVPLREIISISTPMLFTATMAFVVGQTGVIMLGIFHNEAEVGHYSIALKLSMLTTFILSSVNSMAAPKFSDLFHSGKIDELFLLAKKSAKLIFWSTTPILLVLVIFGKLILGVLFGDSFDVAYIPLIILVLGQFVNSISGATGIFMNMTGKEKAFRNIMLFSAILNIGLNIILIPTYGLHGAAFTTMVSLCTWNIATLMFMKIKFGKTTGYFPMVVR